MPSERFVLTLWTEEVARATEADAAGVDRIGLDLETLGKLERQAGLGTWVSPHREEQLAALRPVLRRADLFVRINPIHARSAEEIERVLAYGAQILMLPMFTTPSEVRTFVDLVVGRAHPVLLLETAAAARAVDAIVAVPGVHEMHVGLNDLALSLGLRNRFEVLLAPLLEHVAGAVRGAGWRLGVGGIGCALDTTLPIPSDLIYAQYPRLGATAALLSRQFTASPGHLGARVAAARERLAWWEGQPPAALEEARQHLARCTEQSLAF